MHKKHYINNLYNCIYLQLVYSTYICYYNLNRKTEREALKMKRIEELEEELTKVCGTYENDCSKCTKQAECEEYCKLAQIYEIANK